MSDLRALLRLKHMAENAMSTNVDQFSGYGLAETYNRLREASRKGDDQPALVCCGTARGHT